MEKKVIPLNPMPDGSCRTVKAQYGKNSLGNFIRGGGYGATAVMEIVYAEDNNPREHLEVTAERSGI